MGACECWCVRCGCAGACGVWLRVACGCVWRGCVWSVGECAECVWSVCGVRCVECVWVRGAYEVRGGARMCVRMACVRATPLRKNKSRSTTSNNKLFILIIICISLSFKDVDRRDPNG